VAEGDSTPDTDRRFDIMFDRLLLIDLRQMVSRFDAAEFTALTELKEPSQLILHVLKAVVILVMPEPITDVERCDWCRCLTVCFDFVLLILLFLQF